MADKEKKEKAKESEEKLSIWNTYRKDDKKKLERLAKGYIDFISDCKTERESAAEAIRQAEAAGYRDLAAIIKKGETLKAGAKVYALNMKKSLALFHVGTEPLAHGMAIRQFTCSRTHQLIASSTCKCANWLVHHLKNARTHQRTNAQLPQKQTQKLINSSVHQRTNSPTPK